MWLDRLICGRCCIDVILEMVWIDVRGGTQVERWDLWRFFVADAAACGRPGVREESRRTPQDKQRPENCRGGGVPANDVVGE